MAKPLNNIEKYAIQQLLANNKTTQEIVEELKKNNPSRTVKMVEEYIANLKKSIESITPAPIESPIGNAIIKKTMGGKAGVAIMTPSASQLSDSTININKGRTHKNALYHIKEKKVD